MSSNILQAILNELKMLNSKVDHLNDRVSKVENRFDSLEERFDNLENRFDSLEERVEKIEQTMATKDDIIQLKAVVDVIAEQVAKNAENITKLLFYHEKTTEKLNLIDKRQNTQESILSVLSKRTLHHEEELIRLGQ